MKKFFLTLIAILTLLLASQAQQRPADTVRHRGPFRGFALGVDRDTLSWLVASPFDNWYIKTEGGVNTFIGNEIDNEARFNKLNYHLAVEIGKWMIPDLAVSLRASLYSVDGQSIYGRHPFINKTTDRHTTHINTDENGTVEFYYPFHASALSLMGNVTLDWTNFLYGVEVGYRTRWHVFSMVGFGPSMLFGSLRNPMVSARDGVELGSFYRNFELAFDFYTGVEYIASEHVTYSATAGIFGSESTWDWSPYNSSRRTNIFDLIPSLSVGAKFNLIKGVRKYDVNSGVTSDVDVFHRFQYLDMRKINNRIDRLEVMRDSLKEAADQGLVDQSLLDSLEFQIGRLNDSLDSLRQQNPPANVLDELLEANEFLNLPAVVVYFDLDKWAVDLNARRRLANFAREVLASQYDTCEFYVIGAADSLTGSISHNWTLSDNRASVVRDILISKHGMNPDLLVLYPVGGITVYEPKENNRMTLVILKTPETEAIIRKWPRTERR